MKTLKRDLITTIEAKVDINSLIMTLALTITTIKIKKL